MGITKPNSGTLRLLVLIAGLVLLTVLASSASRGDEAPAQQAIHDSASDFQQGTQANLFIGGTEDNPQMQLALHPDFAWSLSDSSFTSGWTAAKSGYWAVSQVISSQIHVKALRDSQVAESYAFLLKPVSLPEKFVVEYRILFTNLEASGVAVPGDLPATQPVGAHASLDIYKLGRGGLLAQIYTDRIVSVWTRSSAAKDYPATAYIDTPTEIGRWYTLRFEADFQSSGLNVDVYRDGVWLGQLKGSSKNGIGSTALRPMAYTRRIGGAAEFYISQVRLGQKISDMYPGGVYTSSVVDLGANVGGIDRLSWAEAQSPAPWSQWTKYAGNPALDDPHANGNVVENILTDINDPLQQPIQYPHPRLGNKYWLLYSQCCGLDERLAYSDDLLHWTPYEANPILTPGPGEYYLFSGQIFKDGDTYYLVYDVAMPSPQGRAQRIAYATAPSPLGPWQKGAVILTYGAPGEWDEGRVTEPFVLKDGDTYFLYYMGDLMPPPYGRLEQIGLATTPAASFPNGPWVKEGLVLPVSSDPNAWDRGLTADPSIIKLGNVYYMLYTGSYIDAKWKMGFAWSYTPRGPWNRAASNTLIAGPAAWEGDRIVRGSIHYFNGKFYMPYSGYDGHRFRGGMATAEQRPGEALISFMTRTSADGQIWEDWRALLNGALVQSTPNRYLQYSATLSSSSWKGSPSLTSVTIDYH